MSVIFQRQCKEVTVGSVKNAHTKADYTEATESTASMLLLSVEKFLASAQRFTWLTGSNARSSCIKGTCFAQCLLLEFIEINHPGKTRQNGRMFPVK